MSSKAAKFSPRWDINPEGSQNLYVTIDNIIVNILTVSEIPRSFYIIQSSRWLWKVADRSEKTKNDRYGQYIEMADEPKWPMYRNERYTEMADISKWPIYRNGRYTEMADRSKKIKNEFISVPNDRRLIDRILFCSKISTRSALGNWFGKSVKLFTCMLSWVSRPRFFTGIFTFWTWLYDKSRTSRFSKFSNTSIGTFVILLKGSFTTLIDQGKPFKIHHNVIITSSLRYRYVIITSSLLVHFRISFLMELR